MSVGELRSNFKAIEAKLAKGQRVQVTRRGAVVAEMQAPVAEIATVTSFADHIPAMKARMKEIWGDTVVDIDTTALISESRDRDFLS